jgi:UDP-glucose 4-epimerase
MKIFITGAGGLLGGRLVDFFSTKGYEIVALSRAYKGAVTWKKNVNLVNIDITNKMDVHQYMRDVSVVIHAAGMNAADSLAHPSKALFFNGCVTADLVNIAIECSVKHFIYLSTAHVYSSNLMGEINEESPVTNLHPYASSHKAGEDTVLFANQEKKIQGTILRLSNAFGHPLNPEANCWMLLVNDLCKQAVINGCLRLHSDGKQYRNFISITDVCKAIDFIIKQPEKYINYPIINIASKNVISIFEMAKLVQEKSQLLLGLKIPLIVPKGTKHIIHQPFILQSKLFDNFQYDISNNLFSEIDMLLNYCKSHFQKSEYLL